MQTPSPRVVPPRRAFSESMPVRRQLSSSPIAANVSPRSSYNSNKQNIEILYAHDAARIVSFNLASSVPEGVLVKWTGTVERTIASGPIRIYKTIPHNIAFLQSGGALKPVMSKSQCWNVDGRGIFCLQIRPGSYWRLEIIERLDGEALKALEFRQVLAGILAYEITPCPFIREAICIPLGEVLEDALQPSRVWRRPSKVMKRSAQEVVLVDEQGVLLEDGEEDDGDEASIGGSTLVYEGPDSIADCAATTNTTTTTTTTKPIDLVRRRLSFQEFLPREQDSDVSLPSSAESLLWQDFTPQASPSEHRGNRNWNITRSCTAPPQLSDFNVGSSPSISRSSSPTRWHPPSKQPQGLCTPKRRKRRPNSIMKIDPKSKIEKPELSPVLSTPTLWSGASDSDSHLTEINTPSPSPAKKSLGKNTHGHNIPLSRSTSSLIYSTTANIVGAAKGMVILKPSSYIANLMFAIASLIAAGAVRGAAYSLTESSGGFDDGEEYEYDDYGNSLRAARKLREAAWENKEVSWLN